MAFELYSDVILTPNIEERGLRTGDAGTVVERRIVPGMAEEGYSVPRWTPENRPLIDRAKPATTEAATETSS